MTFVLSNWTLFDTSSLVSRGSEERLDTVPTEKQRAGSQLACRDSASVCTPALLLQPCTLTVSLGFPRLAGSAGLSEIHVCF